MKILDYFNYNSYVTLTLFFLSLIVLILGFITRGKSNDYLFSTQRASLLNPLTYIKLFTYILGHEGWSHFRNNYLIILLLGPMIEEKYGWLNYLIMILFTAFITGVINFIIGKKNLKGASGIAFMLIVLSAFVNVVSNKIPLTLILIALFYLVDEVFNIGKKDGVSHLGHIIGALCGLLFGFICLNNNLVDLIMKIL